jgi:hypothetical protein
MSASSYLLLLSAVYLAPSMSKTWRELLGVMALLSGAVHVTLNILGVAK